MPLSEEELRLLEQMERALVEEDPKLASTMRGTTLRRAARRRGVIAAVVFVAGVAVLMAGAITKMWPVGVAGFVIMLGSATVALGVFRAHPASEAPEPTADETSEHPSGFSVVDGGKSHRPFRARKQQRKEKAAGSFMERMEERWRRRRERGGF